VLKSRAHVVFGLRLFKMKRRKIKSKSQRRVSLTVPVVYFLAHGWISRLGSSIPRSVVVRPVKGECFVYKSKTRCPS
jgi:hypothetical protein